MPKPAGYLRIAARRKFVIGIPTVIGAVLAWGVASSLPPQYTSQSVLGLDARKIQVLPADTVVSRLPSENATLRTELDALNSRSTAARVAEQLDLAKDPEFLHDITMPQSAWQSAIGALRRGIGFFARPADAGDAGPERIEESLRQPEIVNWLLGGLRVSNDGRSFTILVTFVSHTAELSAKIANAFASAYLDGQIDLKTRATRNANEWLHRRLEEVRQELQASEAAVLRLRRDAGLMDVKGGTPAIQRLSELNSQLVAARTERSKVEARVQTAKELARSGRDAQTLSDMMRSPAIRTLRDQLSAIEGQLAVQRDRGALRHPTTIALESRATSLSQQLRAEEQRVIDNLDNEVSTARNEESELQAAVESMGRQYGESREDIIRLNQLQREADANRTNYENILNRYKETFEQETLATPDARVLSNAEPADAPSGPKRLPTLILGLVIGSGLGTCLAGLLEWCDRSMRCVSEAEEMAGVPVLSLIPKVPRRGAPAEEYVLHDPRSPFSQALRRTHAALCLPRTAADTKVILVTSAAAGEGKTAFCVSFGRSMAMVGQRVLVIDADLHVSRVGAAFGCRTGPHIGDIIQGRVALADAVQVDARSGVHFIAAVPERSDPQLLLKSAAFAALMRSVRQTYDIVILDTPPVMVVTDAAAISALADATLLVVRWGNTPRSVVATSLRFLHLCGTPIDGIIFSQVDLRRHEQYEPIYDQMPATAASPSVLEASARTSGLQPGYAETTNASANLSPER